MRIGLDARTLFSPQRRGIGKSLLRMYAGIAAARPEWEVFAYHRCAGPLPKDLPSNFVSRQIEIPGDRFDAWTQVRLPTAARLDRVDVLHCPANYCPNWMPVPTVVTLHDLIPLDLPETVNENEHARFEHAVSSACSKANIVCTPSRYTKRRLIEEHGLHPQRAVVVRWGATAEPGMVSLSGIEQTLQRYGIKSNYLLHMGARDPRKNTRGVIEAWAMAGRSRRRDWKLVIVGLDDNTLSEMKRLVTLLGIEREVKLHGYAPEQDLMVLLSAASILLYPSMSEGFGLPVLEAFASATAVLTSDTSSLPEVAGDAAELVPPGEATALASAMTRLMNDPMRRAELVRRGTRRLMKYRWSDASERLASALDIAARTGRRRSNREIESGREAA